MPKKKSGSKLQEPDLGSTQSGNTMLMVGAAVPVVAAVLYFAMPALLGAAGSAGTESVEVLVPLDVGDTDKLHQVFHGGKPWLVLCDKGSPSEAIGRTEEHRNFGEAARSGAKFSTAVVDCTAPMASGKTIFQRFNLDDSPKAFAAFDIKPITILFVNNLKPKQIAKMHMRSAKVLKKMVNDESDPKVHWPKTPKTITNMCFKSMTTACLVYTRDMQKTGGLTGKQMILMRKLAKRFRHLRIAAFNSAATELQLSGKPFPSGMYLFRRLSVGEATVEVGGKQVAIGSRKYSGKANAEKVGAWVESNWNADGGWTSMSELFTLNIKGESAAARKARKALAKEQEKGLSAAEKRKLKRDKLAKERGHAGGSGDDSGNTESGEGSALDASDDDEELDHEPVEHGPVDLSDD